MSTQQLSISFEGIYRAVNERAKALELLLVQLIERADAEDRYCRFMEKVCGQMQGSGGDMDDLLGGIKVDLYQRSQYNKQFSTAFKNDIDGAQLQLKQIYSQYRPICQEIVRFDRELKANQDKYEKAREKYNKLCHEFEEQAIALEGSHWNKESNQDTRQKYQVKLNQLAQLRSDAEGQVKVAISYFTQSQNQFNTQISQAKQQLKQIFDQLFAITKDLVMKTLVYEISRLRNLQYDSEQFFKQVEIYNDPADENLIEQQACGSLNLTQSKEVLKITQFPPPSMMRETADRIATSHRITLNKKDGYAIDETDVLVQDKILSQELKIFQIYYISQVFQRPEPNEKTNIETILQKFSSTYSVEELNGIVNTVYYVVDSCADGSSHQVENPASIQLQTVIVKRVYRETIVQTFESFRNAGQFELSPQGYQNLVDIITTLFDYCSKEQDIGLIKRCLLMICTLYRMDEEDQSKRIFIQDALLENPIFQKLDIWEALIFNSIDQEIDKSQTYSNREQIFKDKNVIFSNLLSMCLNMITFKMDKQEIKSMVYRYGKIFQLYEMQVSELISFVEKDGKVDVSKQVNSFSVLSSLYQGNAETDKKQQQTGPLQISAPKKVLLFEKKNIVPGQIKPIEEKKIDDKFQKIYQQQSQYDARQRSLNLNQNSDSRQNQQPIQTSQVQPVVENDNSETKSKIEQFQVEDTSQSQKQTQQKAPFLKKLF